MINYKLQINKEEEKERERGSWPWKVENVICIENIFFLCFKWEVFKEIWDNFTLQALQVMRVPCARRLGQNFSFQLPAGLLLLSALLTELSLRRNIPLCCLENFLLFYIYLCVIFEMLKNIVEPNCWQMLIDNANCCWFGAHYVQLEFENVSTLPHSDVNPTGLSLRIFCLVHLIVTKTWPFQ